MEEVEEIADKIIIIDKGEKIAEGTLNELLDKYKNTRIYTIYLFKAISSQQLQDISEIEGIRNIEIKDDVLKITLDKQHDCFNKIMRNLIEKNIDIKHMSCEDGNLEMVFLSLTGRKLRD